MAVVFDSATTHNETADGSPDTISWSHSVGAAGSNRCLLVGFAMQNSHTINSVSYAGDTMTLLTSLNTPDNDRKLYVYYLAGPTTGTNSVSVSVTAVTKNCAWTSMSYTGVDQGDPVGTYLTDTGNNPSVALAAQEGWMCVDFLGADAAVENTTAFCANTSPGAGQTERSCIAVGGGGASGALTTSDELGATSTTMSWTADGTDYSNALIAVPLKEASAPRGRVVKYLHNTFVSGNAGDVVVLDVLGRQVPVEQIEFDNWMRTDGPFFPTSRKFSSTVEDPATAYVESLRVSRGRATIETAKESLFESLFRRLGRGA